MEAHSIVYGSEPGLEGVQMPLGFGEVYFGFTGGGGKSILCVSDSQLQRWNLNFVIAALPKEKPNQIRDLAVFFPPPPQLFLCSKNLVHFSMNKRSVRS